MILIYQCRTSHHLCDWQVMIFSVFPEAPWWVEGPWYEPLMVSLVAPDWYRSSLKPFDDMFDPFRDLSRAPKSKFRTVLAHILIFPAGRPSQIFMVRNGLYRRPTCSSCIFVVFFLSRIWRYFGPLQATSFTWQKHTFSKDGWKFVYGISCTYQIWFTELGNRDFWVQKFASALGVQYSQQVQTKACL